MTSVYKDEETLAAELKEMVSAGTHGWSASKLAQRINEASLEANKLDNKTYDKVKVGTVVDVLLTKLLARIASSDAFYAAFARLSGMQLEGVQLPDEQAGSTYKRDREEEASTPSPRQDRKRSKKLVSSVPLHFVSCDNSHPRQSESSDDVVLVNATAESTKVVTATQPKKTRPSSQRAAARTTPPSSLKTFMPPEPSPASAQEKQVPFYGVKKEKPTERRISLPLLPEGLTVEHIPRPVLNILNCNFSRDM